MLDGVAAVLLLDLDRPGGEQRRGGHAGGRLRADTSGERSADSAGAARSGATDRGNRRRLAGGDPTGGRAAGPRACAAARSHAEDRGELGAEKLLDGDQRTHRDKRRERAAVGTELRAEVRASLARSNVLAHRAGHLAQTLGRLGELQLDLAAGEQARLAGLREGDPGAHQK